QRISQRFAQGRVVSASNHVRFSVSLGERPVSSVPVAVDVADLAGGSRLLPVEANEACAQIGVVNRDRQPAGGGTLGPALGGSRDGYPGDHRQGRQRKREAAQFSKRSQKLAHRSLLPALAPQISVTTSGPCGTDR